MCRELEVLIRQSAKKCYPQHLTHLYLLLLYDMYNNQMYCPKIIYGNVNSTNPVTMVQHHGLLMQVVP